MPVSPNLKSENSKSQQVKPRHIHRSFPVVIRYSCTPAPLQHPHIPQYSVPHLTLSIRPQNSNIPQPHHRNNNPTPTATPPTTHPLALRPSAPATSSPPTLRQHTSHSTFIELKSQAPNTVPKTRFKNSTPKHIRKNGKEREIPGKTGS
jgi:hypothetical protein